MFQQKVTADTCKDGTADDTQFSLVQQGLSDFRNSGVGEVCDEQGYSETDTTEHGYS